MKLTPTNESKKGRRRGREKEKERETVGGREGRSYGGLSTCESEI